VKTTIVTIFTECFLCSCCFIL